MVIEAGLGAGAEIKRGCAKRIKFKLNQYLVQEDGLKPLKKQVGYGCKHSVVFPYDKAEVHEVGTIVGDQLGINYSVKGASVNHPIHPVS